MGKKEIEIDILNKEYEAEYDNFLLQSSKTLFYFSNKYRIFLRKILQAEDSYFIAKDVRGHIIGALPAFLKRNKKYGNVLNSLPFFGSNGGLVEFNNNPYAKKKLLDAFKKLAKELNCVASTIISSPFDSSTSFYEDNIDYDFKDERIGQITTLEEGLGEEELRGLFHYKTRNMIRKAIKSNVKVKVDNDKNALRFLIDTHRENMAQIGGMAKDERFFECVWRVFEADCDYKLYIANLDNNPIAGLLLLFFNKTVEYFTPVVRAGFRNIQPLSLVIFEAMKDAVQNGYKYWNWGGTWLTQQGVYRFKKRWGTKDYPYYYYIKIYDKKILKLSKDVLLKEYPYYYVLPFKALENRNIGK